MPPESSDQTPRAYLETAHPAGLYQTADYVCSPREGALAHAAPDHTPEAAIRYSPAQPVLHGDGWIRWSEGVVTDTVGLGRLPSPSLQAPPVYERLPRIPEAPAGTDELVRSVLGS